MSSRWWCECRHSIFRQNNTQAAISGDKKCKQETLLDFFFAKKKHCRICNVQRKYQQVSYFG